MTRRQRQGKHAAEHRHMRDRLLSIFDAADADVREAGRLWYPAAEGVIADIASEYGLGRPAVAAIVAVLSPQQKWRQNVRSAQLVLEGRVPAGYGNNRAKAEAIRDGADPLAIIGGDKVTNFWANLIGSRAAVTIDVWAQRAALGFYHAHQPKGGRYRRLANAYSAAAQEAGERAREFQAIIWLAARPAAEHTRDQEAIHATS